MRHARFAEHIIAWQAAHGRHGLPWQNTRDPYAIWISEIMLQQTQVATVIPYYQRFMARFPHVSALAAAPLDDVLVHWSGLGYYSRARNLHRAGQVMRDEHGCRMPDSVEAVAALPGIGRSTAAAIVVFAYGGRHAILDGNVKRVLARACGITGYPGDKPVADALWRAAERLLPSRCVEGYTQGLMDLGATVCLRRSPRCVECPVRESCVAFRDGLIDSVPAPRPRKALPHRNTVMLILEHAGSLLLEKRPAPGIWGGLWCFPEVCTGDDIAAACAQRFGARIGTVQQLPDVKHGFTHFNLTITPQRLEVRELQPRAAELEYQWLTLEKLEAAAIPAPVKRIAALL
ncbi:MAG: A/G-specific adenine glycosylase [Burkholderiales bacterium]